MYVVLRIGIYLFPKKIYSGMSLGRWSSIDKGVIFALGVLTGLGCAFLIFTLLPKPVPLMNTANYQSSSGNVMAVHGRMNYKNEEVITWVDWRGRERKIVIHRNAVFGDGTPKETP
jgi:hypothetical protein